MTYTALVPGMVKQPWVSTLVFEALSASILDEHIVVKVH